MYFFSILNLCKCDTRNVTTALYLSLVNVKCLITPWGSDSPVLCRGPSLLAIYFFSQSGHIWFKKSLLRFKWYVDSSASHFGLMLAAWGVWGIHVNFFGSNLMKSAPLYPNCKNEVVSFVFSSHLQPIITCKMWTAGGENRNWGYGTNLLMVSHCSSIMNMSIFTVPSFWFRSVNIPILTLR